jgi:hypothetical protein
MGIMACWDVHPAERLYDDELAAKLGTEGDSEPVSMDVLRQTDFQQLILWFAFGFRPAKETFSEKKKCLKHMLGGAISLEDACGAVERFLHGLKPVAIRNAQLQAGCVAMQRQVAMAGVPHVGLFFSQLKENNTITRTAGINFF